MTYNLMSATIPSLKGFTQGFMTAGISLGYATEGTTLGGLSGTYQSYQLRSMRKSKPSSRVAPDEFTESQAIATTAQVDPNQRSTRTNADGPRCYPDEAASIASHDSRKIMIKREWEVSIE
jgi:hypothetical protein